MTPAKILITGGAGFVGHHVVEHFLRETDCDIYVLDRLSYATEGWNRLRDIEVMKELGHRMHLFTADISQPISEGLIKELKGINYILHLAAESHVDKSIVDPRSFVEANVLGTCEMLNLARRLRKDLRLFLYFGTDEVFGPAPKDYVPNGYNEYDRYNSGNPYAATKAGAEELAVAYANTYQLPIVITHTMNCFGERQHPEKFIPMVIRKVLQEEEVTIHADKSKKVAGSRFYIHCRNVAKAIQFIMNYYEEEYLPVEKIEALKFNIVGEKEVDNLQLAQFIAEVVGKPLTYKMVDFHSSRPGHDLRYALDGKRMKLYGWELPMTFEESLRRTIKWYLKRPTWLGLSSGS